MVKRDLNPHEGTSQKQMELVVLFVFPCVQEEWEEVRVRTLP
jgi:hypothetical protein